MGKKSSYKPRSYESTGGIYTSATGKNRTDTSANIFESMLRSPVMKKITYRQYLLYTICKAQLFGKRKPSRDFPELEELQDDACFYLSLKDVLQYPKPYSSINSNSDFRMDMKALIDVGLIDLVSSGKAHRTKSIYRLSSRWWRSATETKEMVNDIDTVGETPTTKNENKPSTIGETPTSENQKTP